MYFEYEINVYNVSLQDYDSRRCRGEEFCNTVAGLPEGGKRGRKTGAHDGIGRVVDVEET